MRHLYDVNAIVRWYTKDHLTCQEIADKVGVTRQSIANRLRRAHVTSEQGEWAETRCAFCSTQIRVTRKRWRTHTRVFCNAEHYYALLGDSGYTPWRHGSRLARAIVAQHFDLRSEQIVHHKDGDQRHNDLSNLAVYASHADHMAHHRGRQVDAVWDGASPG